MRLREAAEVAMLPLGLFAAPTIRALSILSTKEEATR
jgi:hypothetical protein